MKSKLYLSAVLLGFATQVFAQCANNRYLDKIFSNVTITSNITYTTSNNTNLKLDVYEPQGDIETMRPLIILAHGGSFIGGSKTQDNVVTTLCNNFAKRGYVCASISYRLGNPLQMLDSSQAIDVVMKAISDGKSAVRFFRKDAATTNTYKIDPTKIFVGGNSAGAVLYMHHAYIDSLNEAPLPLRNIITANGGIEGNSGNDGYSSDITALINLAGGLNVPEFVGPGNKPSVNFHGDQDDVVPYGCANAQGGVTPVRLCGLGAVESLYQQYGINHSSMVFPGDGHTPWQSSAPKFNKVDSATTAFLYQFVCGITSVNNEAIDNSVEVFPNPAQNVLQVRLSNVSFSTVELFDINGRLLNTQAINSNLFTIERNSLPAGFYTLRFSSAPNGPVAVKRVIFE